MQRNIQPMADIDVEALTAPITEAAPCGADLEYDAAFLELEEAARGKPEQQYGDTVIAAQDPDWRAMRAKSLELFERTRDLRVAVSLLRGATRTDGLPGFVAGIRVLQGLLDKQWDHVFPLLDTADNDDPTMRLNALAPLGNVVLADLRAASIGPIRNGLNARTIELAFGKGTPGPNEAVMSEPSAVQALGGAEEASAGLLASVIEAHTAVTGIQAVLDAKAGAASGPDLRPLRVLTQTLAQAAASVQGDSPAVAEAADLPAGTAPGAAAARGGSGAIASRDDAVRTLDRVCEWLERAEPSNPAPLLIRRAQRLMSKSFIDIIRDLAPDGLKEVERIAGVEAS